MTPDEAAWVRTHIWTPTMRRSHDYYPPPYQACACQHGPSQACAQGQHHWCHHAPGWAATLPETWITHGDETLTGPGDGSDAVWVTGCCATWRCHCHCHTAPAGARHAPLEVSA